MLMTRVLKFRMPMMVGEDVRAVQQTLLRTLPDTPFPNADGVFGNATKRGIEQFQKQSRISVDGVVGEETWTALFGVPTTASANPSLPQNGSAPVIANKRVTDPDPPLGRTQTIKIASWLRSKFGGQIDTAVQRMIANGANTNPAIDFATIAAIAAKETGFMFLRWIDEKEPTTVLQLCIGDASGDVPGTMRNAYPRNLAAFKEDFRELAPKLIAASNRMRAERMPKLREAELLYKGYGMFQYDLQHIDPRSAEPDKLFFQNQLWGDMDECLTRVARELQAKQRVASKTKSIPDLQTVVTLYNGGGDRARVYGVHVMTMREWCAAG